MQDRSTAVIDPTATCPSWCDIAAPDHGLCGDASWGFHHEGAGQVLDVQHHAHTDARQRVVIKPTRFVDSEGVPEQPNVEVFDDDHQTLMRLTPAEARYLAHLLTTAADVATEQVGSIPA